jgi:hypothetical protein
METIIGVIILIASFVFIFFGEKIFTWSMGMGGAMKELKNMQKTEKDIEDVLETGTRTDGVVTLVQPTHMLVNDDPVAIVTLEVKPKNGESFTAVTQATIPQVLIPQIQPGKPVTVAYDPDDQSRVAIVFEERVTIQ